MRVYSVQIGWVILLPTFFFACMTATAVLGNLLYVFTATEPLTNYTFDWWFWGVTGCSVLSTCTTYTTSHVSDAIAPISECDSFVSQLRAVEAFALLSSFFGGIFSMGSIAMVLFQQILTMARVHAIGLLLSGLMLSFNLVTFVLAISLKDRSCMSATKMNFKLQPASFMYIGGVAFALINMLLYQRMKSFTAAKSSHMPPTPPPYVPVMRGGPSQPQQQPQLHQVALRPPSPERSTMQLTMVPIRPSAPTVVPEPHSSIIRQQSAERGHTESPAPLSAPRGQSSSPPPKVTTIEKDEDSELEPLPEGDDWKFDADSGLMWSEDKKLFFDRGSGQFYDPESEQWYDPVQDLWYDLSDR